MTCRYCDKPLGLLRRMAGQQFCSAAHERRFRDEQDHLVIHTLLDTVVGAAPAPGPTHLTRETPHEDLDLLTSLLSEADTDLPSDMVPLEELLQPDLAPFLLELPSLRPLPPLRTILAPVSSAAPRVQAPLASSLEPWHQAISLHEVPFSGQTAQASETAELMPVITTAITPREGVRVPLASTGWMPVRDTRRTGAKRIETGPLQNWGVPGRAVE